ncbi:MAG: PDZ domain-containing protein [Armatimonadota bacterium]|nr:MAG: PDZ domain-containing protein [Armatimonadota bacterium]
MRGTAWHAAALAIVAALAFGVAGPAAARSNAQEAKLIPSPGAGAVSVSQAQGRADFVVYLPTYVPKDPGEPVLFFAPEQELAHIYVPTRLYASYSHGIGLWQMPTLGRPLRRPAAPVDLGGRRGWASDGPGAGRMTLEWQQGDTQLGITAPLPIEELFKIAASTVQAAPDVPMSEPSQARLRHWTPPKQRGLPSGGIGVMLVPGTPPTVLSLEPGGPAAAAGVQSGDVITAVDGRDVSALPIQDLVGLVRGEPGTEVRLALRRKGASSPIRRRVRREALPEIDLRETTPAQARSLMPFPVLQPEWLPRGYRLLTCVAGMRDGKPWETRLIYSGAGKPLILVSQTDARAPKVVAAPAKGTQEVQVGHAAGTLNMRGGVMVSWTQGKTAMLLQSRFLPREAALKMARSMR